MNYAAIDWETYFDDECSIKTLGTDAYICHPNWYAYSVAIVTSTGLEWVGDPFDMYCPWGEISGSGWEWLAHNASFDERVHHFLKKWNRLPSTAEPELWHCTADLCAFSAAPRALAKASEYLYNEKVSKDYRTIMKGKHFSELSPDKQQKVRDANLTDSRKCLRFFNDLSPRWPENERRLSRLSRRQAWHGLRLDKAALSDDIDFLKRLKWKAECMIPWQGVEKNLSYPALVAECQKVGIEAPASVAMGDDECAAWEDKYGDQFPWIDAMRVARRTNGLLVKCETMYSRIREEDGRMPYQNKYFGAHTGRWGDGSEDSGNKQDKGFNSRNLPRKEMFGEEFFLGKLNQDGTREPADGKRFADIWVPGMKGVNLRNRIIPADGCHFQIADLSQIEPRCLWWIVKDHEALKLCAQGLSPYEAHAISSMGWKGGSLKKLAETDMAALSMYQLAKARVLALGYQAGWLKFIQMAPTYVSKKDCELIFGAPVTEEETARFSRYLGYCRILDWLQLWAEATDDLKRTYINSWKIVQDFRASNPLLAGKKGIWKRLDKLVRTAVGDDFEMTLPSGRVIRYKKITEEDGDIYGTVMKYGKPTRVKLYGGKLTENLIQAIARDIFGECLLRLEDAGHWTALHAHDEAVNEVLLSVTAGVIEEQMSQAPDWMKDLTVASDVKTKMYYTK